MKGLYECPGEHTINKNDDGRYWLTCGTWEIEHRTFDPRNHGPSDVQQWAEMAMESHLVWWLGEELRALSSAAWRIVNEVDEFSIATTEGGDRTHLTDVEAAALRRALTRGSGVPEVVPTDGSTDGD